MATIKDVAKLANTSVTTVSRVINNRGYISGEMRRKVNDAMNQLQYAPHQIARALSGKQTFLLGLILPDATHPFFAQMIKTIEEKAQVKGYKILICNSLNDAAKERDYISMLRENRVDGIIMGSHSEPLSPYEDISGPMITFERSLESVPCITSDNFLGGQLATKHLLDKGCRSLLHISGPLDLDIMSNRRADAFNLTCQAGGVDHHIMEYDYKKLEFSWYERFITGEIGPVLDQFDGVFCSNDYLAYALWLYCRDRKRKVPEDLRIVGYDYCPFTRILKSPRLSTVAQPIELLARLLCEGIIDIIEKKEVHSQQVTVELIEGETT